MDDDPLVRRVGQLTLERAGYAVAVASSIAEALGIAASARIDAAIVDYFLASGECGCDLIAPLRSVHPSIRITILSGLGMLGDLVRHTQASGADHVASKTTYNWLDLARPRPSTPAPRASAKFDLEAYKRDVIHGTYLVHNRNTTAAARALGIERSTLQRRLRRCPAPDMEEDEE